jgi:hypothetical protein
MEAVVYKVQFNEVVRDWEIVKSDNNEVYDYGFTSKESAEIEAKKMQFELDNPHLSRKIIDGSYVD